jgi:hypothetical protein
MKVVRNIVEGVRFTYFMNGSIVQVLECHSDYRLLIEKIKPLLRQLRIGSLLPLSPSLPH